MSTASPKINGTLLTDQQIQDLKAKAMKSSDFKALLHRLRGDNYVILLDDAKGYRMTIDEGGQLNTTLFLTAKLQFNGSLASDLVFEGGSVIFALNNGGSFSNLAVSEIKVGYVELLTEFSVKDGKFYCKSLTAPDDFFGCNDPYWLGVAVIAATYALRFLSCALCALSIPIDWVPGMVGIDIIACSDCFTDAWRDIIRSQTNWCSDPVITQFTAASGGYTNSWIYPFTASATIAPTSGPATSLSYQFKWGDGQSDIMSGYSSGASATTGHYYASPGTYSVYVHVVDNNGNWADSPTKTVTITQNPSQPPGGGCPVVAPWNGTNFVADNNILPSSENLPNVNADVKDFYQLRLPLQQYGTSYALQLQENEYEQDYFNQVSLTAVYHEAGVSVATSPYGQIFTYSNPASSKLAADEPGVNVADWIKSPDDTVFYQGVPGRSLYLSFSALKHPEYAKLLISEDMIRKYSTHVSVLGQDYQWHDVGVIEPRANWYTSALDISRYVPRGNSDIIVKLYFTGFDKIDWVSVDDSAPSNVIVQCLDLVSAFDQHGVNVALSLVRRDGNYAVISPGQYLTLYFEYEKPPTNMVQDFILSVTGHYVHLGTP